MDEHELIVAVKQLAMELGQTPSRDQFVKNIKSAKHSLYSSNFKTYSNLLTAAGLTPPPSGKRISSRVFERNIEDHLEKYTPRKNVKRTPYPSIAVISDIHWPFSSQKVIDAFLKYVEEKTPEWVVINGDAWDMYSHTKFPRSHNTFTPREEETKARQANEDFWKEVQKRSPKSQCVQMLGNHDVRPMKRILEVYPEAEDWVKERLQKLFSFEGVRTIHDIREELVIGDIAIFHGYRSKLGDHRDTTLFNCINGHTHKGGTVFRNIRGQVLWEGNSGLAGDPEAKGLTYTPQKITDWTPGFLAVDSYGPRFIWV